MNLSSYLNKEKVFWQRVAKGPSYQLYLEKTKKEKKKPLSKKNWEAKVFGTKDSEKSDFSESRLLKERVEAVRDSLSKDLQEYGVKMKPKDLKPEHREFLKDYNLDVVGSDAAQAVEIARKLEKGIKESADVCKISPAVCVGNKGLSRDKMPQIEGGKTVKEMLSSKDPLDRKKGKAMVQAGANPEESRTILQQMIDHLSKNRVRTTKTKIPVGKLKATQKEIKASKTFGMADSHLKGDFDKIDQSIVVSRDGHILDGHHRWAALLTIDPKRKMNVKVIDMDMDDLLKEAASFPGVYKANFKGNPLSKKDQEKYKKENKSSFYKKAFRQDDLLFEFVMENKKLAFQVKRAIQEDLAVPERASQGALSEFKADLWKKLRMPMKKVFGNRRATMTKKGSIEIWKWEKSNLTCEMEIDEDGNVELSFMTYLGGPGFNKRFLAPRVSDISKSWNQGYNSLIKKR